LGGRLAAGGQVEEQLLEAGALRRPEAREGHAAGQSGATDRLGLGVDDEAAVAGAAGRQAGGVEGRGQRPLVGGPDKRAGGGQKILAAALGDDPAPTDDDQLVGGGLHLGIFILVDTWRDLDALEAPLDLIIGAAALLALWFRRSRPTEVAVFTVVASAFSAFAGGPGVVALFNAAIRTPARTLAGIVALAIAATAIFPLFFPGSDPYGAQLLVGALINGVVVGWGLFVRAQRELVNSLRERAREREAEHELHVEQARDAERRRIAREMHDVLVHRVSLLSLHAGALEFRPDAPPEEVANAAGVIRSSARAALEELRQVVGVLREGAPEATPEPPQPTLAQIPALIDESRAAGVRVALLFDAPADETIPAAVGRTAYRIVQEGLTKARKHAPGAGVEVAICGPQAHELVVAVVSRQLVGVATRAAGATLPGAGTGLIGLAERVALAGGRLEHGPDARGDFVLRASLPLST
jgi:signal transduction histidine kinase